METTLIKKEKAPRVRGALTIGLN